MGVHMHSAWSIKDGSLVLVSLRMVVCIEGFFLHFFSFQFVVFVHTFSHVLQASVLSSVLNNNGFALCLHLLRE